MVAVVIFVCVLFELASYQFASLHIFRFAVIATSIPFIIVLPLSYSFASSYRYYIVIILYFTFQLDPQFDLSFVILHPAESLIIFYSPVLCISASSFITVYYFSQHFSAFCSLHSHFIILFQHFYHSLFVIPIFIILCSIHFILYFVISILLFFAAFYHSLLASSLSLSLYWRFSFLICISA